MSPPVGLGARDQQLVDAVRDALGSSLDLRECLERAYPLLLRVMRADYAALGNARPDAPDQFEWIVANLQPAFFAAYPEMAEHDFVLRAVSAAPNRVLRDSEMLTRWELQHNMMYVRARELGMPLEHVMSVMLHADAGLRSGISLYRSEERPFSDRELLLLQSLTPAFANAVRNCRSFGALADRHDLLERLLEREGRPTLILDATGKELARGAGVERVLDDWFGTARGCKVLPQQLTAALEAALGSPSGASVRSLLKRVGQGKHLLVRAHYVVQQGRGHWLIVFEEELLSPPVPSAWRLTPRERQVAELMLRGSSNLSIAVELCCAEGTVIKHAQHIFAKARVSSRAELTQTAWHQLA